MVEKEKSQPSVVVAPEDVQKKESQSSEPLIDTPLRGRIITGMPLSVAAQKRISKQFEQRMGRKVRLSCRLDKQQIAGIRVELDGYSYDGTIKGQLADIFKLLISPDEEG